jgi:hypothetical protein
VPRLLALTAVIWALLVVPAAAFPPTGFCDLTVERTGQQSVSCKGKREACPFKRKALRFHGRGLKLAGRFEHRKLPAGTVITIVVSKPGLVAKTFRYKLRPAKFPSVRVT